MEALGFVRQVFRPGDVSHLEGVTVHQRSLEALNVSCGCGACTRTCDASPHLALRVTSSPSVPRRHTTPVNRPSRLNRLERGQRLILIKGDGSPRRYAAA